MIEGKHKHIFYWLMIFSLVSWLVFVGYYNYWGWETHILLVLAIICFLLGRFGDEIEIENED